MPCFKKEGLSGYLAALGMTLMIRQVPRFARYDVEKRDVVTCFARYGVYD